MTFELKDEFIPLNVLLKVMRVVESGGQANMFISSGEVIVNSQVEAAKRKKIRSGDVVEFQGISIEVI